MAFTKTEAYLPDTTPLEALLKAYRHSTLDDVKIELGSLDRAPSSR